VKTITFYSYKGGVGRSLLLANVARYLARRGKRVFCVDFDLEAPGLHYKFGLQGLPKDGRRGLIDIIEEDLKNQEPPESLAPFVLEVGGEKSEKIWLIPAGKAPSSDYWAQLSKVDWHELFYGKEPDGPVLFLDLKAQIEKEYAPDYLLIDARTGITEMGGVATSILADQVVVLLLNSEEHLEGSRAVLRSFHAYRGDDEPLQTEIVLSRLPTGATEASDTAAAEAVVSALNQGLEGEHKARVTRALMLHNDPEINHKESLLLSTEPSSSERVLFRDYLRLVLALIKPDEVDAYLGSLVDEAKSNLLVSPDEAEKSLEDIVRTSPHTEALATLLRIYRVRNREEARVESVLRQIFAVEGAARLDFAALWEPFSFWFPKTPPNSLEKLGGASKVFFELWKQSKSSDFNTVFLIYGGLLSVPQHGSILAKEWVSRWENNWAWPVRPAKVDPKITEQFLQCTSKASSFFSALYVFDIDVRIFGLVSTFILHLQNWDSSSFMSVEVLELFCRYWAILKKYPTFIHRVPLFHYKLMETWWIVLEQPKNQKKFKVYIQELKEMLPRWGQNPEKIGQILTQIASS